MYFHPIFLPSLPALETVPLLLCFLGMRGFRDVWHPLKRWPWNATVKLVTVCVICEQQPPVGTGGRMNLQRTAGARALLLALNFTKCMCHRSFSFQDELKGQVGESVVSVSSVIRAKTPSSSFN